MADVAAMRRIADSVFVLAETCIALSSLNAAEAASSNPALWDAVGAVLNIGTHDSPSLASATCAHCTQSSTVTDSTSGRHTDIPSSCTDREPGSKHARDADVHSCDVNADCAHVRECVTESCQAEESDVGDDGVAPCYLWVRVRDSKLDRQSLQRALPQILTFMKHHLLLGRTVLLVDDDGVSSSYQWLFLSRNVG